MLAGEAAPIVQLPCEKPNLAPAIGRASNEMRAAAGRAGHMCQGTHRVASCGAGDTPPAPTAVPTEAAGHPLVFFTKHFEIRLQNPIEVHSPLLQIPPPAAGHGVGRAVEADWALVPRDGPSARTVCCHPPPGYNPSRPQGGHGWSPYKAVPRCWAQPRTPFWDAELSPPLPAAATHRVTASFTAARGCQQPQDPIPTAAGCASPPCQCQPAHERCPLHQLASAGAGAAAQSSSLVHPAPSDKPPKSWQKGARVGMLWQPQGLPGSTASPKLSELSPQGLPRHSERRAACPCSDRWGTGAQGHS